MKVDKFLLITVGALMVVLLVILALGGAAFLCLFFTADTVSNDGPVVQRSYDYNGTLAGYDAVSLDVANINGNVNVTAVDGDSYAVSVAASGTDMDFERYVVDFTEKDSGGVHALKLEVKDTKEHRLLASKYNADVTIGMPRNKTYDVTLVTVNGRIDLGELSCGELKLAAVNGALASRADSANATMATVNGNIDVDTGAMSGSAYLNTVNGHVSVHVPGDAPLSLNAHVVNGAISGDLPLVVEEKSRMALVGKTANYTDGIYIEASIVNGNIDVVGR